MSATGTLNITPEPEDRMAFMQHWLTGKSSDGEVEFDLSCGAGLGGSTVKLTVTCAGHRVVESFDIRPLVSAWVDRIVKRIEDEA